jgi:hypothetical protein
MAGIKQGFDPGPALAVIQRQQVAQNNRIDKLQATLEKLTGTAVTPPSTGIARSIDPIELTGSATVGIVPGARWAVTILRLLTGPENAGGMHNIFVRVKDKAGVYLNGIGLHVEVEGDPNVAWDGETVLKDVMGTLVPGYYDCEIGRGKYRISVHSAYGSSDIVHDITTDISSELDQPSTDGSLGRYNGHYSTFVEFTLNQ